MKIDLQHVLPDEIEKRSFEIIEEELHGAVIDELQKQVDEFLKK